MEGGGHDAPLPAPKVTFTRQQAVAESRLEDLSVEPPFDVVMVIGEEDVLDKIGLVYQNESVENIRSSLKSLTKASRPKTASSLSRSKRRNRIRPSGSAGGSGTTPGS